MSSWLMGRALQPLRRLQRLLRAPHRIKLDGGRASIHTLDKIGNREIVGYGWNGTYCYYDRLDYPFPPIRFQEPNNDINALREKECCSWKKLTAEEKKQLYRHSFCQTFAEIKAPTGKWKISVAHTLFICALAYVFILFTHAKITNEMPITFDEEHQRAQLKRMIALEVNPITGLASKWDYEKKRWK